MKSFKIAIAQFSPHVGNLDANTQKMIDLANQAKKDKADLIIFPELSTLGYPAEDLLIRPSLVKRTKAAFEKLTEVKILSWSLVLLIKLKMVNVITRLLS